MAGKRKAATPPLKKKVKTGQTSINNFFTSPSKGNGLKREASVISIADSSSDGEEEKPSGEAGVARSPESRYGAEQKNGGSKGKARAEPLEAEDDDGIEIVKEEVPVKKEGVNGSSSSKIHPLFSTPRKSEISKVKHEPVETGRAKLANGVGASPAGGKEITSTSAEPVEPIDFDVDQFLFRPADIDITRWPKGRLPYSVLVGVYVQVSSTRSRLLIVRVLTK